MLSSTSSFHSLSSTWSSSEDDLESKSLFFNEDLPNIKSHSDGSTLVPVSQAMAEISKKANKNGKNNITNFDDSEDDERGEDGELRPALVVMAPKFGWIKGVFIRVILSLFGVYPWLRFPYVVAQAGVGLSLVILVIGLAVALATTLSIHLMLSNGKVKGGGCYALSSRLMGPAFGAVVGVLFSFSLVLAMTSKVMGFAEAIVSAEESKYFAILGPGHHVWELRIWGIIGLTCIILLVFIGLDVVIKNDAFQLVVLVVCLAVLFAGAFTSDDNEAKGFQRANTALLKENWGPKYEDTSVHKPFFYELLLVFPALTGLMAGLNVSGDLRNPRTAVGKGTALGIAFNGVVYAVMMILAGACFDRHVLKHPKEGGFKNKFLYLEMSATRYTVYLGIIVSSLASAISNLVGAPRILMALAQDRVFPIPGIFARGYGRSKDPRGGYVLCWVIGVILILTVDLSKIAALVTNFFLLVYMLLCGFAFALDAKGFTPGWRASASGRATRYLCLCGSLLCFALMVAIDIVLALISYGVAVVIYVVALFFVRRGLRAAREERGGERSAVATRMAALSGSTQAVPLGQWGSVDEEAVLVSIVEHMTDNIEVGSAAKIARSHFMVYNCPAGIPPLVSSAAKAAPGTLLVSVAEPGASLTVAAKLVGLPGLRPVTVVLPAGCPDSLITEAQSAGLGVVVPATAEAALLRGAKSIQVFYLGDDGGLGLFLAHCLAGNGKGFKGAKITLVLPRQSDLSAEALRVRVASEVRVPGKLNTPEFEKALAAAAKALPKADLRLCTLPLHPKARTRLLELLGEATPTFFVRGNGKVTFLTTEL